LALPGNTYKIREVARSIRFASAALRRVCGAPAAGPMNRLVEFVPIVFAEALSCLIVE
jgi:hypothetical protein